MVNYNDISLYLLFVYWDYNGIEVITAYEIHGVKFKKKYLVAGRVTNWDISQFKTHFV